MLRKIVSVILAITFSFSLITIPQAQAVPLLGLPEPGRMVNLSSAYKPVMLKGLTVNKNNPFLFDFLVDTGDSVIASDHGSSRGPQGRGDLLKNNQKEIASSSSTPRNDVALQEEVNKLVKYFLASLTIPKADLWVNLSPYEKDRTIPAALGNTEMGRDLLAQDYLLKQITASLIYPEKELGKSFWDKVYQKIYEKYSSDAAAAGRNPDSISKILENVGTVNTFNKVWIVADKAEIYEHNQTAFVVNAHFKVMLEEDYQASRVIASAAKQSFKKDRHGPLGLAMTHDRNDTVNQIVRDIILPELEKEVNEGKNFAPLRQISYSLILASWYKNNLKNALLTKAYADQNIVKGLEYKNSLSSKRQPGDIALAVSDTEFIYQQYIKAYKKGVFNYIREESADVSSRAPKGRGDLFKNGPKKIASSSSTPRNDTIVRKYFSGGWNSAMLSAPTKVTDLTQVSKAIAQSNIVSAQVKLHPNTLDAAMSNARTSVIAAAIITILINAQQIEDIARSMFFPRSAPESKSSLPAQIFELERQVLNTQNLATSLTAVNALLKLEEQGIYQRREDLLKILKNIGGNSANTRKVIEVLSGPAAKPLISDHGRINVTRERSRSAADKAMRENNSYLRQVKFHHHVGDTSQDVQYKNKIFLYNGIQGYMLAKNKEALKNMLNIGTDNQMNFENIWSIWEGMADSPTEKEVRNFVLHFAALKAVSNQAMTTDRPIDVALKQANGGIDLKTIAENTVLRKQGLGVEFTFDPAMFKATENNGIKSLTPEVITIIPINVWPLLGLQKLNS